MGKLNQKTSELRFTGGRREVISPELERFGKIVFFLLDSHAEEGAVDAGKYERSIQFLQTLPMATIKRILTRLNMLEHWEILEKILRTQDESAIQKSDSIHQDQPSLSRIVQKVIPIRVDIPSGLSQEVMDVLGEYNINPYDSEFSGCILGFMSVMIEEMKNDGPVSREQVIQAMVSTKYFSSFVL